MSDRRRPRPRASATKKFGDARTHARRSHYNGDPPRARKPGATRPLMGYGALRARVPPRCAENCAARRSWCSFFFSALWGCSLCSGFLLFLVLFRVPSWSRSLLLRLCARGVPGRGRSSSPSRGVPAGRLLSSLAPPARRVLLCFGASGLLFAGVVPCGVPVRVACARLRGSSLLPCRASACVGSPAVPALSLSSLLPVASLARSFRFAPRPWLAEGSCFRAVRSGVVLPGRSARIVDDCKLRARRAGACLASGIMATPPPCRSRPLRGSSLKRSEPKETDCHLRPPPGPAPAPALPLRAAGCALPCACPCPFSRRPSVGGRCLWGGFAIAPPRATPFPSSLPCGGLCDRPPRLTPLPLRSFEKKNRCCC